MMTERAKDNLRRKLSDAVDKARTESGYKSPIVECIEVSELTKESLLEAYDGSFGHFGFTIIVNDALVYPQIIVKIGDMQ